MTSYRFSLSPKDRKVGRFLGKVRREIQRAFSEEREGPKKLSQAEIGRMLGVHRSVINRQLNGTENLTLSRVAELAWALDRDLVFYFTKSNHLAGSNHTQDVKREQPNTPGYSLKSGTSVISNSVVCNRKSDLIISQAA